MSQGETKQVEEILNRWRTTRNVTESGALFTAVEELRKVFNAGQQCIEMYQHPFAQIAHSRCKLDTGHEGMHNSGTYRWLNMPHPAAVEMPEMCSSKAADGATACDYTKGHTGPHRNVQAYKEWNDRGCHDRDCIRPSRHEGMHSNGRLSWDTGHERAERRCMAHINGATRCNLNLGHVGDHAYPVCNVRHPYEDLRCALTKRHTGYHKNGSNSWESDKDLTELQVKELYALRAELADVFYKLAGADKHISKLEEAVRWALSSTLDNGSIQVGLAERTGINPLKPKTVAERLGTCLQNMGFKLTPDMCETLAKEVKEK